MKPAIIVKTVNGKQYLQLRTIDDDLIHIGPVSRRETWKVAYRALKDEYEQLVVAEILALYPIAARQGFTITDCLSGVDVKHPVWQEYLKKRNKKSKEKEKILDELERKLGIKIARTPWEKKWAKKRFPKADKI